MSRYWKEFNLRRLFACDYRTFGREYIPAKTILLFKMFLYARRRSCGILFKVRYPVYITMKIHYQLSPLFFFLDVLALNNRLL